MTVIDQLVHRVRDRILDAEQPSQSMADAAIDEALGQIALDGTVLSNEPAIRESVTDTIFGFGALQPFISDTLVEEIWINQPNRIYVAKSGRVTCHEVNLSESDLRTIVLRMLRDTGRRIDSSLPFADAVLSDGSRLHVVIPDVTAAFWSINIRKFPAEVLLLADLVRSQTITDSQREFLHNAVHDGKNILISGATHSGKTTMLAALLSELPNQTRLISCEETFELRTTITDWVAMQARQPNLEGRGEIPLRRLVKEALRMRPDRLVIGEVREAEALDLLIAMNSGVSGACTIHANSARAALTKICTLPLLAGPNISSRFVLNTVADAIDVVVHCKYLGSGRRIVSEIALVGATDSGEPTITGWVS